MTMTTHLEDRSMFRQIDPVTELPKPKPWEPLLVTKSVIDAEIGRLTDLHLPANLHRAAEIVHPRARNFGTGLTAGMALSVNVVLPGEELIIPRDNANRVEFGLGGEGSALIGERSVSLGKWNTWTVPSMLRRHYRNDGDTPLVWFSYSNVPLLERLGIHYSDDVLSRTRDQAAGQNQAEQTYVRQTAPDIAILDAGARLRGYEYLTDIEVVENNALLWPWHNVVEHLSTVKGDGKRGIMLLYHPATGRRNGTTHSFFATIGSVPPGGGYPMPARGHKHSSFAVNYHFQGAGHSVVDGQDVDWSEGDLMLSAPAWSEHAHAISDRGASVLTIQDHPLQIGMESLIWQEKMDGPILALGSEPGQTGYEGPRHRGGEER